MKLSGSQYVISTYISAMLRWNIPPGLFHHAYLPRQFLKNYSGFHLHAFYKNSFTATLCSTWNWLMDSRDPQTRRCVPNVSAPIFRAASHKNCIQTGQKSAALSARAFYFPLTPPTHSTVASDMRCVNSRNVCQTEEIDSVWSSSVSERISCLIQKMCTKSHGV